MVLISGTRTLISVQCSAQYLVLGVCPVPGTTDPAHSWYQRWVSVPGAGTTCSAEYPGQCAVWCWCPVPTAVSGVKFLKQCQVSVSGSWCGA